MDIITQPNSGPILSREAWAAWLETRLAERAQIYSISPADMISAARREREHRDNYHGREILELLQNADDAGRGFDGPFRVALVLTPEGLCVANTGLPFSPAGVESLMISDNSPKQLERAAYIGNKGLGFRAVLNWTDAPMILSGELSLGFSSAFAAHWLQELCSQSARLRAKVEREREHLGEAIKLLPTLAVPHLLDHEQFLSPRERSLFEKAVQLRDQGYQTVIAMPFFREGAYGEARRQIAEQARPELLLFVNHLEELSVITPEGEHTWTITRTSGTVTIRGSDEPETAWRLIVSEGEIPAEYLLPEHRDTPRYTIALAMPLSQQNKTPGVLFSYFPTGIPFPFPLIAHATLMLKSDRQDIVQSEANRYVLAQLAMHLAEELGRLPTTDPWGRLKALQPYQLVGSSLKMLGFADELLRYAQTKPLLPTLEGPWLSAKEVSTLKQGDRYLNPRGWIPARCFGTFAIWPEQQPNLERTLQELKPYIWPLDDFLSVLPDVDEFTLQERADLIDGCLHYGLFTAKDVETPPLLVDDAGRLIEPPASIFLPPSEGDALPLPPWSSIAFVNRTLVTLLQGRLRVTTLNELRYKLACFDVSEYRLEEVVRQLARAVEQRVAQVPAERTRYLREALICLFGLFVQSGGASRGEGTTSVTIRLPTLTGEYEPANTLYLHESYPGSELSRVTGRLYARAAPERVVADALSLGFGDASTEELVAFLRWCGVAEQPREKPVRENLDEFRSFVLGQLEYPVQFRDMNEAVPTPDMLRQAGFESLKTIEELPAILAKAEPEAILAWAVLDRRVSQWASEGDSAARLSHYFKHKHHQRYMRGQTLPSYVIWRLAHTEWLPAGGQLREPRHCLLVNRGSPDLESVLPSPGVNSQSPLFQSFALNQRRVKEALRLVGVAESVEAISWDDAYQLLLDLPRLDPDGRAARQVYRALLARSEPDTTAVLPARQRFLKQGKMLAQGPHGRDYYACASVYYRDSLALPSQVYAAVTLAELDQRRGPGKVERLFGVKPIGPDNLDVKITATTPHPQAAEVARALVQAKPHLAALRLATREPSGFIARLKAFELLVCVEACGHLRLPGEELRNLDLNQPDEQLVVDTRAYLVMSPAEPAPNLQNPLVADRIGEMLAVALQFERGSDFARLLGCGKRQRSRLLANILGLPFEEAEALVTRARELLQMEADDESDEPARPYVEPPQPPAPPAPAPPPPTPPPSPPVGADGEDETSKPPTSEPPATGQGVQVTQVIHTPAAPHMPVTLRISRTPDTVGAPRAPRVVADAAKAEKLVVLFEEQCGRFPLPAAHMKGRAAYGCDVLSFATASDRDHFREQSDEELVARFIEVKSTTTTSGEVTLAGNELEMCERRQGRYFIYRVFEPDSGPTHIYVLGGPLDGKETVAYKVNVLRNPRSEHWTVEAIETDSP